eukprot:TRINITY_DN133_c0_g1_i1.p1 TRINITY_DN133_c0_g1~~TRINITY_DN133_c0_g1_i1.p1  ORF type:complete len:438 (+),score=38.89 TRINITY_DN133_c0_g1_i1:100-1314(+)
MHVTATVTRVKELVSSGVATISLGLTLGIGGLLSYPCSKLYMRLNFKYLFLCGIAVGCVGATLSIIGAFADSGVLLLLGAVVHGPYWSTATLYRFAGMELAPLQSKPTAASLVVFGGILGALAGPQLAVAGKDAIEGETFAVSYMIMLGLLVVGGLVLLCFNTPPLPDKTIGDTVDSQPRPWSALVKIPTLVIAILNGTVSYSMMTMIMSGTPIAMHDRDYSLSGTNGIAFIIQMHFVAMFLPSVIAPLLVRFFGPLWLMVIGCLFFGAAYPVYFIATTYATFMVGLVLVGLGWNLLFVGATVLLPTGCRPAEKPKVTAVNELFVFGSTGIAICITGTLVKAMDWPQAVIVTIPFIALSFIVTVGYLIVDNMAKKKQVAADDAVFTPTKGKGSGLTEAAEAAEP